MSSPWGGLEDGPHRPRRQEQALGDLVDVEPARDQVRHPALAARDPGRHVVPSAVLSPRSARADTRRGRPLGPRRRGPSRARSRRRATASPSTTPPDRPRASWARASSSTAQVPDRSSTASRRSAAPSAPRSSPSTRRDGPTAVGAPHRRRRSTSSCASATASSVRPSAAHRPCRELPPGRPGGVGHLGVVDLGGQLVKGLGRSALLDEQPGGGLAQQPAALADPRQGARRPRGSRRRRPGRPGRSGRRA